MATKIFTTERVIKSSILALLLPVFTACGDEANFIEKTTKLGRSADAGPAADETSQIPSTDPNSDNYIDPLDNPNGAVVIPGQNSGEWAPDWVASGDKDTNNGTTIGDSDSDTPIINVPDVTDSDVDALKRCLKSWKNHPFGNGVTSVRKIYAAVTIGGFGNAINDTCTSAQPELVLIYAGVNVGGAPTWNLRDGNAYYCAKVNVNVGTDFNINLAENARLADSSVNVNVGSTQSDRTSGIGVHVGSNVTVNYVEEAPRACN